MSLPLPFACPVCDSALHDDGTCGVCAANETAQKLLVKGCSWCGRTHLRDTDLEPGWFSFWSQDRADLGRDPGVICVRCLDGAQLLPASEQDAFIRVLQGLPRNGALSQVALF